MCIRDSVLRVGKPLGANLIKIVASTKPQKFQDTMVVVFENGFGRVVGKGEEVARSIQAVVDADTDNRWYVTDVTFEVTGK